MLGLDLQIYSKHLIPILILMLQLAEKEEDVNQWKVVILKKEWNPEHVKGEEILLLIKVTNITIARENVNQDLEAEEKEDLIHVAVASKYISI